MEELPLLKELEAVQQSEGVTSIFRFSKREEAEDPLPFKGVPEKLLLAAILRRAIFDLWCHESHVQKQVINWFQSTEIFGTEGFTFWEIKEYLELSHKHVKWINKKVAEARIKCDY